MNVESLAPGHTPPAPRTETDFYIGPALRAEGMHLESASTGAGIGLGIYGLVSSADARTAHMQSGNIAQAALAIGAVAADSAAIGLDGAASLAALRGSSRQLLKAAGPAGLVLGAISGTADTISEIQAGNREAAAANAGGTAGGILGGLGVGLLAGGAVGLAGGSPTGPGALVTGLVGGIVGGIGGAIVGAKAAEEYASGAMGYITGLDSDIATVIRQLDPTTRKDLGLQYNGTADPNNEVSDEDIERLYAYAKDSGVSGLSTLDHKGDGLDVSDLLKLILENKDLQAAAATLDPALQAAIDNNKNGTIDVAEVRGIMRGLNITVSDIDTDKNGKFETSELTNALTAAAIKRGSETGRA